MIIGVWTEDQPVASGHDIDPARWQDTFEAVMGRIASRFARVEPRRHAREFVLGLLAGLPRKNCWTLATQRPMVSSTCCRGRSGTRTPSATSSSNTSIPTTDLQDGWITSSVLARSEPCDRSRWKVNASTVPNGTGQCGRP